MQWKTEYVPWGIILACLTIPPRFFRKSILISKLSLDASSSMFPHMHGVLLR
jgi:hypothetical protein